jgi:hypothetical protein
MESDFDILADRHRFQSEMKAEESRREREDSLIRQRRTRGLGRFRRDLRKQERSALRLASSTEERRLIKERADEIYNESEFNLDTGYEPRKNNTSKDSNVNSTDGKDQTITPESTDDMEGSGGGDDAADQLEGFSAETLDVVQNDNTAGTREFLTKAT